MADLKFTSIDRVLAKVYRDLKTDINESDAIEWIGEALDFLKVFPVMEQAVTFLKVENHEARLPNCLRFIYQVARNINWTSTDQAVEEITSSTESETESDPCTTEEGVPLNCQSGLTAGSYDYAYYRPVFDLVWEYELWRNSLMYKQNFVPLRLSDHTFFNTVVASDERYSGLYDAAGEEYTIVGSTERKLRFSFEEGYVAISYLRDRLDSETGYPLIPDDVSFITAITYYVKWKLAEWYEWIGRQGAPNLAQDAERKWLKYARQAKNRAKRPETLDEYYNLMRQTYQITPLFSQYENYFRTPIDAGE